MGNIVDEFTKTKFEKSPLSRDEYGNFEANLRFLSQLNILTPQKKTLEIGSGKGRLLNHYFRRGYDIRGVDISEHMISESRRLYGDLPFYKMSGDALAFKDSSFDLVLSFDVLEHIPDTDKHLHEVRRVLKSEGHYVFETPNEWTNTIFETIRWRSFYSWRMDHCSLHNYWALKRRLKRNGFEVAFYDVPAVNDYFEGKVEAYLGNFGLFMLRLVNVNRLPGPLRTNFYVIARKYY